MKKLLIGLAGLLVVLVVAVLVVPGLIDWNGYKPQIRDQVREATGRDLEIDGDISLGILPAPALTVANVRFANAEGLEPPHMATLERLEVRVAFGPLLSGRIQVESVRLVRPLVHLQVAADGTPNWQFRPAAAPAGTPAPGAGGGGGGLPAGLSLDDIRIVDGTVVYEDLGAGTSQRIEELGLIASAGSLQGPFEATGSLRTRGLPLDFEARAGALDAEVVPVRLLLAAGGEAGQVEFTGTLADLQGQARAEGTLKVAAADVAALVERLAPGTGAGLPARPLSVEAALSASPAAAALNDLKIALGDLQATGSVEARLDQPVPQVQVRLAANRVDLDALLPPPAAGGGGAGQPAAAAPAAEPVAFALPDGIAATIDVEIDGVQYRGDVIRQVRLQAALAEGTLTVGRAGALLPGGSDLSIAGTVAPSDATPAEPRFAGDLELASDNLRGLLQWLEADVGQVPQGRLASMSLTTKVTATPSLLQLAGINLRLDQSTLTGGVSLRPGERPGIGADLALDRINLDGYLPPPGAAQPAAGSPAAGAQPAPAAGAGPLSALNRFDANLKLAVQQLVYNQTPVEGVVVDVTIDRGSVEIRQAAVRNLAGASASASGRLNDLAGDPKGQIKLTASANDLSGVARLAGVQLPVDAGKLGKAQLDATLDGDGQGLKLDGSARLAGATIGLDGRIEQPTGQMAVSMRVDANHPSLAGLSKTFGLGVTPIRGADAPVTLQGTVDYAGNAARADLTAGVAGSRTQVAGGVEQLDATPALAFQVTSNHPDARALLRGLGIDYRPALGELGAMSFRTAVVGSADAVQLNDIALNFGPAAIEGQAAVRTGGVRPYVSANLNANEVILDMLLPPAAGQPAAGGRSGRGGQPAAGGQRWSREPLDLSGLQAVDADVKVQAAGLVFRDYAFQQPQVSISLKDGTLTLEQLAGRLFQGQVNLSGRLAGAGTPSLALKTELTGANMAEALQTATGSAPISGTFRLSSEVASTGDTEYDLVRNLAGGMAFAAENGIIQGLNLKLLSDQLANIRGLESVAAHAMAQQAATQQTSYSRIGGTFAIRNGVARIEDLRGDIEAGLLTGQGEIDLPDWRIDMAVLGRLSEHPDAPPIGIELKGPLDAMQRDIKTREMETFIARRVIEEGLGSRLGDKVPPELQKLLGVTGGSRQQPQEQQPQAQEPQQQQQPSIGGIPIPLPGLGGGQQQGGDAGQEAIKGLLNNLLKPR